MYWLHRVRAALTAHSINDGTACTAYLCSERWHAGALLFKAHDSQIKWLVRVDRLVLDALLAVALPSTAASESLLMIDRGNRAEKIQRNRGYQTWSQRQRQLWKRIWEWCRCSKTGRKEIWHCWWYPKPYSPIPDRELTLSSGMRAL